MARWVGPQFAKVGGAAIRPSQTTTGVTVSLIMINTEDNAIMLINVLNAAPTTQPSGVQFTLILVIFNAAPPTQRPYRRGSKGECCSVVSSVGPCPRRAGGAADLIPGR